MLDEFEIINWVRYIDRFEFEAASFGSSLLFIGMSTKLLLNNLR